MTDKLSDDNIKICYYKGGKKMAKASRFGRFWTEVGDKMTPKKPESSKEKRQIPESLIDRICRWVLLRVLPKELADKLLSAFEVKIST